MSTITNGKTVSLSEQECELLIRLSAAVADGRTDEGIRDAARAAWTLVGHRLAATAGVAPRTQPAYADLVLRLTTALGPTPQV